MKTYLITVVGLVQGVGFRPFIYRLANEFRLTGWVKNTNRNVQVCLNTSPDILKRFIERIREQSPPAAELDTVDFKQTEMKDYPDFRIVESESISDEVTEISPDIAVCPSCLADMKQQPNRSDYPFLNCTNCGPRFTIIRDLPYDRDRTTMDEFEMCGDCRSEYENILDRRFHAQPTACRICGPVYSLGLIGRLSPVESSGDEPVLQTARIIDRGGIVSVKGLGGFFMACDAGNDAAVKKLRESKHREGKPFAAMFRDPGSINKYCRITETERVELESWRRPIVILRNHPDQEGKRLSPSVSNGFPTTGCMLPYMPFHYLLFEKLETDAIVMTSGNLSEEPILIGNELAEEILGPVSDAVLCYNRDIYNRCDDSVGTIINEIPRLLRRSRGYVPGPLRIEPETEGIFAAGAELVNCFAIGKGRQVIMSQHIGDLKNYETFSFYTETYERFERLFRFSPTLAVHDLHPDYLSTCFAEDLGVPTLGVQHHHAHIASVLAEYRLDEKVIGISFDGTGLGDDGNIWGSEFLICDLESYIRKAHLEYIPMPGGDRSTYEPWRLALSLLYKLKGKELLKPDLPFMKRIDPASLNLVLQSIEKNINCPLSSGAGRLFDAVSALLNICTVSDFHAEAPMRLEAAIIENEGSYPWNKTNSGGKGEGQSDSQATISVLPMVDAILDDLKSGINPGIISARFHNSICNIISGTTDIISAGSGLKTVALSGGSFQNRYLSTKVEIALKEKGYRVLVPSKFPVNDGGLALGQLAIAAKLRSLGKLPG